MRFELFKFQKKGVDFLLSKKRALLADSMGLGKTVQTLEAIRELMSMQKMIRVLIVSPASLTLMWEKAIRNWFYDTEFEIVHLREHKKPVEFKSNLRFVIVSYNFIQKKENVERLSRVNWDIFVTDESQAFKNWKSKTCLGVREIVKTLKGRFWTLTGTPATRSASDYYPYLELLMPGKWGSLYEFKEFFCELKNGDFVGVKESKRPILRQAFKKIMLRRLKEKVLPDLPKKMVTDIEIEVENKLIIACKAIDKKLVERTIKAEVGVSPHIASIMREVGLAKVAAAIQYINGIEEPIIVFCRHTDVLEAIHAGLESFKTVGRITGLESREEKFKSEEDFQKGSINTILLNMKAGGLGITLTAGSHILFVEQDWSPAVMWQCTDRAIRIGQKARCVQVVNLIASDTLDDDIRHSLSYKEKFMREIMNDE